MEAVAQLNESEAPSSWFLCFGFYRASSSRFSLVSREVEVVPLQPISISHVTEQEVHKGNAACLFDGGGKCLWSGSINLSTSRS